MNLIDKLKQLGKRLSKKNINSRQSQDKIETRVSDPQKHQEPRPRFSSRIPRIVLATPKKKANNSRVLIFWKKAMQNPTFNYQFLWVLIVSLSIVGLLMQFSSVTIRELHRGVNPFWGIGKPLLYLGVGYMFLFLAKKLPAEWYLKFAVFIFIGGVAFQNLVFTGLGRTINGNRNWIIVPGTGIGVQPSEFLKIAFIVLLAAIISQGYCNFKSVKSLLIWMGIPYLICVFFVYLGNDMGTALVFTSIMVMVCYLCGIKKRFLAYLFVSLVALAIPLVLFSSSRIRRVKSFLFGGDADPLGTGFQTIRAKYGLGTGGLTGIGPGGSREKWLYLPEAQTDFIYAILGEEMGFLGCMTVILLFICLAWVLLRLVLQAHSLALRVYAAGAVGWIIIQAIINIMVVIGIFPVVGLPLPLISSGGSSQASSMILFGIIFAFMQKEPSMLRYLQKRRKKQALTSSIQARTKR